MSDVIPRTRMSRSIFEAQPSRVKSVRSTTPWLAIHVLRSAGKTLIFFVDRPKA